MAEGAGQPADKTPQANGVHSQPAGFLGRRRARRVRALFTLWAASDLPGMRGFAFGPGTAPRLFGWLLVATGALRSRSSA